MRQLKKMARGLWCLAVHCGIQDRWRKLPNEIRIDFECDCGLEWVWAPAGRKT